MGEVYEELRLACNVGEQDQSIYLAWKSEDGLPDQASSSGSWRDGLYSCGYDRDENGRYFWWRDRESGVVESAAEAWDELPRLIADPDYAAELPLSFSALQAARWAHEYMALQAVLDREGRRRLADRTYAADGPPASLELREMRLGKDPI